ncbi:hypothetical protein NY547_15045 [Cnuibacter physcomitrellae]|uniref:MmyB family transcriptional regulator n=1 Tax=Cnuibacter physcomitrellae TaxID=1619308 RepID=UPI002175B818|nr:hypothetical protein [Cnuibacter physcomitrellae]MCS5498565.1 hypothetical protein [Cnuibacter physcomitrellae]
MSAKPRGVPPELEEMIDSWPAIPAFIRDRYLTVVAANGLARSVSPSFREGVNLVRSTFLDSDVLHTSPHPRLIAEHVAGTLRESLSRHESDGDFEQIVEELSAASTQFAAAWNDEEAVPGEQDTFTFPHDIVGALTLGYQQLSIPRHFDLTLVVWRPADEASRTALAELEEIASGASEA